MRVAAKPVSPKAHLASIARVPHPAHTREGWELMDRNERTGDFPPEVMRELRELISPFALRAYPEPEPLYQKLAAWLGVPRETVLLTMGADGALKAIFEVFVDAGEEIVGAWPAFAMYPVYCQMVGARWTPVPFHEDLTLPLGEIVEQITDRTKLVVLANPNQPVERAYDDAELRTLVERCVRHGAILVMDEAYHHFCPYTALPLLGDYPNLFVVRSFSKAFGIAGLRLGYCVSHQDHITALNSVRPIAEVHAVAVAVGGYLLDHLELMTAHVAEVNATRAFLRDACGRLGLPALGQWGNWLTVPLPSARPAQEVALTLRERGFLVRAEAGGPPPNHLRVTGGGRRQAERFLAAFEEIMAR